MIPQCSNLRDHMVTDVASSDEEIIEGYRSNLEGLVECLRCLQVKWQEYEDILGISAERFRYRYQLLEVEVDHDLINIDKEQLLHLSSLEFTWSEIASLMGVSRMTIYRLEHYSSVHVCLSSYRNYICAARPLCKKYLFCRRLVEFALLDDSTSMITDAELSSIIDDMHSESPTLGVTLITGRLRNMGYRVSRERIRNALRASDPLSSALRFE